MPALSKRRKLSTTVSRHTQEYLEGLVSTGRAASLAEAVDFAVEQARRLENRLRLEQDTAAYFARLTDRAAAEEARLEAGLGQAVDEISFDY
jgi:Arc/MetJ-type ribon-helix-helix transcriptional regulator